VGGRKSFPWLPATGPLHQFASKWATRRAGLHPHPNFPSGIADLTESLRLEVDFLSA
jgi:hypothetical protein